MLCSDAASDAITHFIGLFQLADLKARLRLDYDELAAVTAEVETGRIATLDLTVPHAYAIRDIAALVRYVPPDPQPSDVANGAPLGYLPVPLQPLGVPVLVTSIPSQPNGLPDADAPVTFDLVIPPPPSVSVVIVQHLTLSDEDRLDADDMDHVSAEVLGAELDGLVAQAADAAVQPDIALPATNADFMTMAAALRDAATPEPDDAAGAEAHGLHLNGEAGAGRPEFDDLLPEAVAERRARDEDDDGPTHEIVHGGNTLVNEVVLTASWISAPVMVVGGASCSVDMISQVNIWQDSDSIIGAGSGAWDCFGGATNGINLAELTTRPFPVPAQGDGDAPAFWAVTTIEGSLINFNWVEQRNFVSDGDVTSITLTASKTTMILGANQSVNAVSLFELGAQFDMIVVDGNLINLAAIFQTNVLLDSDHVTLNDGGGRIGTGDNLLVNDASILQVGQGAHVPASGSYLKLLDQGADGLSGDVLKDSAFAGIDVLRVLHVKGDLISAQIIEQINILGDADQVDLLAARAMENAGDVSVVTGSNILVNSAHIAEYGVDSTIHARGGVYSDALIHQAELIDTGTPYAGAGLASEAVVFLADGMAGTPGSGGDDLPSHVAALDAIPADPMQTVLS